jgi:hypothetical protein
MSLVITRKESGESLGNGIRQSAQDGIQLAAFDSGQFFVYAVSDLPAQTNTNVLAQISPGVRRFLTQAEG